MKYSLNDKLANTNSLFDKEYFEDMDLNEDMEKIYSLISDEEEHNEYEKEMDLSRLRISNHKRYHKIKISLIEDLPNLFYLDVKEIKKIYNKINEKKILIANYEESEKNKYRLIQIEDKYKKLKDKVEIELKKIIKLNDQEQKLLNYDVLKNLNVDKDEKKKLLNYYDKLIIISSNLENNVFLDYKNEYKRRKYLDKIRKIMDKEEKILKDQAITKELKLLNSKIDDAIIKLNYKIDYLNKLIKDDSEYKDDYSKFKTLCNTITSYDKENIEEARDTYKILCLQGKLDIFINKFENAFLQEIEKNIKGKNYEKLEEELNKIKEIVGLIENNYYDILNKEDARYIRNIKRDIKSKIINVKEEIININNLIKRIWHSYLTNIYSYNSNNDYHFICSNNQFIEPIYESILITKDIINNVDSYSDYQIGFICNNVDNIMYITNNNDVTEVKAEEKKLLKLPIEIENNFKSFSECYKIALDGNNTVLTAVYFIDDNDIDKLSKAVELANTYDIPLIRLKRDN